MAFFSVEKETGTNWAALGDLDAQLQFIELVYSLTCL